MGDLLHALGALAGREYLAYQQPGHGEREKRDDGDNDYPGQVRAAYTDRPAPCGQVKPRHLSS
jgi:hypothetical protein